ncbi:MAG: hypothetical protein HQL08_12280 [Nitrospirae bacterium]|nr:hypothetical protein [Nitrospirota bacterium]
MVKNIFNNPRGLLTWAVEIIGFLFSAFGGFLTNIAPPNRTNTTFSVGIVSFLLLIILLIVTASGRQAPGSRYRKRWIAFGTICFLSALPAVLLYWQALQLNTYDFPCTGSSTRHLMAGVQELTVESKNWIETHPYEKSACDLEMNLPSDQIWDSSAMLAAGKRLMLLYTWLVISLSTALFSLVEANSPYGRTVSNNSKPHEEDDSLP